MTAATSAGGSGSSAPQEKVYLVNVGVKLDPDIFNSFRMLAIQRGVTVSEMARNVITSHVAEPATLTLMKTAMREVMAEFKKGSNPSNN
jgi:hypothetical protein